MRIVAGAAFANRSFQIPGQTFTEPRGRAQTGEQHVSYFMEIGSGARKDAIHREVDCVAARGGYARVGAEHKAKADAGWEVCEVFQFAKAAHGKRGELSGIFAGQSGVIKVNGDAATADHSASRTACGGRRVHLRRFLTASWIFRALCHWRPGSRAFAAH